jgi:hypothetical protein
MILNFTFTQTLSEARQLAGKYVSDHNKCASTGWLFRMPAILPEDN